MLKPILSIMLCLFYQGIALSQNFCSKCDIKITSLTQDSSICTFAEKMPVFGNKSNGFINYIYSQMTYEQDSSHLYQDDFKISFVIDKNGKVRNTKILGKLKKDYTLMEKQIVNIFSASPNWTPGECGDIQVPILIKTRLKINLKK